MGRPETTSESAELDQKSSSATGKKSRSRARVYKNLMVVGFMLLLSYSTTSPTNTLMTSISGKTLGNITFCLNNIFSCLFNFVSTSVLSTNGATKRKVMIIGNASVVVYAACNWYVSYYSLIPGTVFYGFGVALTWISSLTYTSKLAIDYAKAYNLDDQSMASIFTGTLLALGNAGHLVGSATTAGVLTLLKSNEYSYNNDTHTSHYTDSNFSSINGECHTNDDELEFNFVTIHVLRGLIMFYAVLALAIIVLFLDDIDGQTASTTWHLPEMLSGFVKSQCRDIVFMTKLFVKKEVALSCFRCFALGASISFMFTRFTKVNFCTS